jgi:hypothetical protein
VLVDCCRLRVAPQRPRYGGLRVELLAEAITTNETPRRHVYRIHAQREDHEQLVILMDISVITAYLEKELSYTRRKVPGYTWLNET